MTDTDALSVEEAWAEAKPGEAMRALGQADFEFPVKEISADQSSHLARAIRNAHKRALVNH
jgi:hypothetical protein